MKKDGKAVLFHLRSDKQLKKLASTANEVVSIIFNTILEEICSYITLEDSSSRKYVFLFPTLTLTTITHSNTNTEQVLVYLIKFVPERKLYNCFPQNCLRMWE